MSSNISRRIITYLQSKLNTFFLAQIRLNVNYGFQKHKDLKKIHFVNLTYQDNFINMSNYYYLMYKLFGIKFLRQCKTSSLKVLQNAKLRGEPQQVNVSMQRKTVFSKIVIKMDAD